MSLKSSLKSIQTGKDKVNNLVSQANALPSLPNVIDGSLSKVINKIDDKAGISKTINKLGSTGAAIGAGMAVFASVNQNVQASLDTFSNIMPNNTGTLDMGSHVSNIVPAAAGAIASKLSTGGITVLTYPETLKNVALNPAHINFQFFDKDTQIKLTSINLPMPDNVVNPSRISWDQENFGMVGDAMVKSLKAIQSKGGEIKAENIQEQINSMGERLKSVAFYTGMSNVVSGLGGQASAEGIMGQVGGRLPNPYRTMLFRGVDFRTFSFEFRFVPFSESDCDLIDQIISKFREHAYPDFAEDQMFFTYPDECQIIYMWETGHNKWLNSFKRAVCTGIDVNFAPLQQWTSMRNGFPNMIIITTTWSEVEIITKNDIRSRDNNGQRG